MVYMDYVVSYLEGIQVIDGQLFALFDRAPHRYPLEAVEYLMVGVAACPGLAVYESGMDILALDEFRDYAFVLGQDASYSLQLRFFLAIYVYLVTVEYFLADILGQ